jgi:hypothetical protein
MLMMGGPLDGELIEVEDGWPMPDAYSHHDFNGTGQYVRLPLSSVFWWTPSPEDATNG